jgi:hypothetical protein
VTHILWLDEHNELLAKRNGYQEQYKSVGRVGKHPRNDPNIGKADYSGGIYMFIYGGFYHDMDFYPLVSQSRGFKAVSVSRLY